MKIKYKLICGWDRVKRWAWDIFAPDALKLANESLEYFQSRYKEVKTALDICDKEYEADLNELTEENSRLTEELEKVKAQRDTYYKDYEERYRERISAMIEGIGR